MEKVKLPVPDCEPGWLIEADNSHLSVVSSTKKDAFSLVLPLTKCIFTQAADLKQLVCTIHPFCEVFWTFSFSWVFLVSPRWVMVWHDPSLQGLF